MPINCILKQVKAVLTLIVSKRVQACFAMLCIIFSSHTAYSIPAQVPLFQANSVKPIMMLNMSKDHQLFFKIYDDYSDITSPTGGAPDGIPDRGFVRQYDYYGYFDSGKCYTYSTTNNRFEPSRVTDPATGNKSYCNYTSGITNEWSGNFLNWASMTRIDAIRKILYGGYRSTDSNTETVLERAFLPNDAHSFAKFYDGNDIGKLTPFYTAPKMQTNTTATGITICNTTAGTGFSQSTTAAPLIRVAKGNYTLWASNERWQCRWDSAGNGNVYAASGINAYSSAPSSNSGDKLGTGSAAGEYYVRVQVCKSATGVSPEDNCQQYPSATYANKPTGLLQKYGETNQLNFGLITGTYGKNKSGGVLRKNVGNMLDEINTTTYGTFKAAPTAGGIINTLNLLRLYGYNYDVAPVAPAQPDYGSYSFPSANSSSANCGYGLSSFTEGNCSNWGNPQSEIYYESLRYLAGVTPTAAFSNASATTDASYVSGLTQATWSAPLTSTNFCAPLSILQFNASSNSYDTGASATYTGLVNIGLTNTDALNSITNEVGDAELITSTSRFVGMLTSALVGSAPNGNQLCTAKTIDSLSNVSGTCPDSPRLDGGYNIVGLARHARKNGIPIAGLGITKTIRTYGVALAPSLPKIEVAVPGTTTGQKVIIQPACRNNSTTPSTNCAIVDFKIVSQTSNVTFTGLTGDAATLNGTVGSQGKLYVNWEDSEQGGDYDQDMWGVIEYAVTATKVMVKTQVLAQSTPNSMGFGYVLTGTNGDGFNVQSGINNFLYGTTCTGVAGSKCTCRPDTNYAACATGADYAARTRVFDVATSSASFMESPLYYAAKWGGYDKDFATNNSANLNAAIKNRNPIDTYFFATDPRALAESLSKAFKDIAAGIGSATSVATVSAKVSDGDYVYQAQFNSENWSGNLQAFTFAQNGSINANPALCSSNVIVSGSLVCTGVMANSSIGRNIFVNKAGSLVTFNWLNLTTSQQASLKMISESTTAEAIKRVDWLSGNSTYEVANGGILRDRGVIPNRKILGDIINSSPVYVGNKNFRYNSLQGAAGSSYLQFVDDKRNMDKLLFVGSNDGMLHAFDANTFAEKFAFIPNSAFSNLAKLTMPDYGTGSNPHSYFVDGPLTYSDAYIGGQWRRIVVGTMGAGAKAIYALDVTTSTPRLLFEISQSDYPALGYVMGKPSIVPMRNGRWAVIFGNGDSSSSTSKLFIIDLEQPLNSTYSKVLDAGEGTGMSTPAIEVNGVGEAINAYAGDLNGNLWRFDLQSTNASSWQKAYKLFKALTNLGVEQPITGSPTLGINASKDWKTMVYFGTGKYYDLGDVSANIGLQAFYAIADIGSTVQVSSLLQKNITYGGISGRTVSTSNPTWATQNGWYLRFDNPSELGERITSKPILLFDKLVFQTLIPSAQPCEQGGTSWIMEVVAVGDRYVGKNLLNQDIHFTNPIPGEINQIYNKNTETTELIVNPTGAGVTIVPENKIDQLQGRESWHQVQ